MCVTKIASFSKQALAEYTRCIHLVVERRTIAVNYFTTLLRILYLREQCFLFQYKFLCRRNNLPLHPFFSSGSCNERQMAGDDSLYLSPKKDFVFLPQSETAEKRIHHSPPQHTPTREGRRNEVEQLNFELRGLFIQIAFLRLRIESF